MELKVGDVVFLNSNPEIKMTVILIESDKIQAIYFNSILGKFEFTPMLSMKVISITRK